MAASTVSVAGVLSFLPKNLKKKLLPFQREGIKFALSRKGRCLIGDEMGLGKTLQAISVAYNYQDEWPLLIIVPTALRYPWIEELEKWLPELQPTDINLIASGTDIRNIPTSKISIVGYGLFRNDAKTLMEALITQKFEVVIVDESHYMKNSKAARTKLLMPLIEDAKRAILLTGTPALGRPSELYTQINSIRPNMMGSWHQFAKRYCDAHWHHYGRTKKSWDTSGASNLDELHRKLKGSIMIRREKKHVLTQLPPKRRQKIPFELAESVEKKEIEQCFLAMNDLWKPQPESSEHGFNPKFQIQTLAGRMYVLTGKAKIGAVCEYVKLLLENQGLKFLVFAHHKEMMTALVQTVMAYQRDHKAKFKYIRIDGGVPSLERMHLVRQFQTDDDTRVAILSILAAGTGLTFTAASQVVFAELHWTPGVLEQCEDRAHRIGQMNAISVHYLVARGTMDEWIWSALSRKVSVLSSALNGKLQLLKMEEGGEEYADLLKHAAAWLPSNQDDEDDDSFYFSQRRKDNNQDIRKFFTPTGKQKAKKTPTRTKNTKISSRNTDAKISSGNTDSKTTSKNTVSADNQAVIILDSDDEYLDQPVAVSINNNDIDRRSSLEDFVDTSKQGPIRKKNVSKRKGKTETPKQDPGLRNAGSSAVDDDLPDMKSAIRRRPRKRKCISKDDDIAKDTVGTNSSIQNSVEIPSNATEAIGHSHDNEGERSNVDRSPAGVSRPRIDPTWSCSACTFENHYELPICEICSTPRKNVSTRSHAKCDENLDMSEVKPGSNVASTSRSVDDADSGANIRTPDDHLSSSSGIQVDKQAPADDVSTGIDDITAQTDDASTGIDDITAQTDDTNTHIDDFTTAQTDDASTGIDEITIAQSDDASTHIDEITTAESVTNTDSDAATLNDKNDIIDIDEPDSPMSIGGDSDVILDPDSPKSLYNVSDDLFGDSHDDQNPREVVSNNCFNLDMHRTISNSPKVNSPVINSLKLDSNSPTNICKSDNSVPDDSRADNDTSTDQSEVNLKPTTFRIKRKRRSSKHSSDDCKISKLSKQTHSSNIRTSSLTICTTPPKPSSHKICPTPPSVSVGSRITNSHNSCPTPSGVTRTSSVCPTPPGVSEASSPNSTKGVKSFNNNFISADSPKGSEVNTLNDSTTTDIGEFSDSDDFEQLVQEMFDQEDQVIGINGDLDNLTKQVDHPISESESEEEEVLEPQLYDAFLFCCSKYTERIYLFDQDKTALHKYFFPLDVRHRDMDSLPDVLHHPDNLKLVRRFISEWFSLTEVKRKQLRRSGYIFDSPAQAHEALKKGRPYEMCKKRFLTKEDLAESALEKAKDVGGTVRIVSKPAFIKKKGSYKPQKQHQNKEAGNDRGVKKQVQEQPSANQGASPGRKHIDGGSTSGVSEAENDNPGPSGAISIASTSSSESTHTGTSDVDLLNPKNPILDKKKRAYLQVVDKDGCPLCLFCGNPTITESESKHRGAAWDRRYCSEQCKEEHGLRGKSTKFLRGKLLEAEHGICQQCGLHAHELFTQIRDLPKSKRKDLLTSSPYAALSTQKLNDMIKNPFAGQFWHADHIVAVYEGGGLCSLDNLRTLCVMCHDKVTHEQNRQRWKHRKIQQQREAGFGDITKYLKS